MPEFTDTKIEMANPCPKCGKVLDCATGREGATPSPGDQTICFFCACYLKFDSRLRVVAMSALEFRELPQRVQDEMQNIRCSLLEQEDENAG